MVTEILAGKIGRATVSTLTKHEPDSCSQSDRCVCVSFAPGATCTGVPSDLPVRISAQLGGQSQLT